MLEEESVGKDVATTHFTEENTLSSIVEKTRIVPGQRPSTPEEPPQSEVLDECHSTAAQPGEQPDEQPDEQHQERPTEQPQEQPEEQPNDDDTQHTLPGPPKSLRRDYFFRQPAEQPEDQPAEQPAQPAAQPNEQPTAQPVDLH